MRQQIVAIHGGNAFEKYEDYLEYLKSSETSLERLKSKDWKSNLAEDLGSDFDVILPRMPNSFNARYIEWKIWFEKITPFLNNNIIFIGHSLGGIFLSKFLSENTFPKKIKAVFLVGAPFNTADENPLVDFNLETSIENFQKQAEKVYLYHSRDDEIVPFSNFERYKKELPAATVQIFENHGHFNMEHFPELIDDIKNITGQI